MKGLQEIIARLQSLREPAALATLVRVKGSTYRKPGARLLLGPEGPRVGAISGGCLETDVAERTREVLATGRPRLLEYDLSSELDLIWGTGMGCEGQAEILLEPITPGRPAPWIPFCGQVLEHRRACVLMTVFGVEGEVPCEMGDRFVFDDRDHGLLPIDAGLSVALHRLAGPVRAGELQDWTRVELPGGAVLVSLERVVPPLALWIYGAGESAKPLAALARQIGWYVGVVDHRPALATAERFPEADLVAAGAPREVFPGLPLDARSAAMVMTHVYSRDLEALEVLLPGPASYVGLQGNRNRSRRILKDMADGGFTCPEDRMARLHYPAGLDLGAEAPEAIALSILAEAHAVLAGRHGGHLRERTGTIH
jgi:xanthine/CO dehydrogenase XdhC/CoxF family maturation factor